MTDFKQQMAFVQKKLDRAKAHKAKKEREFERAERLNDLAWQKVSDLQWWLDDLKIQSWGGELNVKELLDDKDDSYRFYKALEELIKQKSDDYLNMGGQWYYNDSRVIRIRLDAGNPDCVKSAESAILFLAPHMATVDHFGNLYLGGEETVLFDVNHIQYEDCAFQFHYQKSTGKAFLVKCVNQSMIESTEFSTVLLALEWIQQNISHNFEG